MGKITAIDLGSFRIKAITIKDGKRGLAVTSFASVPTEEGVAALAASGMSIKQAVVGLAGKDMTLRYTQVPPSPDWQLANLMELEIQDMAGQSGGELSADYNLLPIADEEGGMETVLLAFARNEALSRIADSVTGAGGSVVGHVPNCVALYNAYLRCGPVEEDTVVCLVNLGHETTDIAIVRGVDLLFVRNLSSGGRVFDDAIGAAFNVKSQKAEALKRELLDLDPASRGRYASGQAEKVTMAAGGAGNMMVSAIQSSIAFCRSQTKIADLQLDRVLLCGGSARVRGVQGMLREALRTPVELFDPFATVDLSELDPASANDLDGARHEAVIALGLAATKLDPSLYQLEILPESVKRRRAFFGKTIFNIGAAAIGVALLVMLFVRERGRVEAADLTTRRLSAQKSKVESVHQSAQDQLVANATERAKAEWFAARAMPLQGALLTLRAMSDAPREIWLEQLDITNQRSAVRIKGKAKDVQGGNVGEKYQAFLSKFKAQEHDGVRPFVTPRSDQDGSVTTFTWDIDFRPEVAPDNSNAAEKE